MQGFNRYRNCLLTETDIVKTGGYHCQTLDKSYFRLVNCQLSLSLSFLPTTVTTAQMLCCNYANHRHLCLVAHWQWPLTDQSYSVSVSLSDISVHSRPVICSIYPDRESTLTIAIFSVFPTFCLATTFSLIVSPGVRLCFDFLLSTFTFLFLFLFLFLPFHFTAYHCVCGVQMPFDRLRLNLLLP